LTGQWGSDGPALGAPTCWLFGQVHSVWSQNGPKRSPGGPAVDPRIKRQPRPPLGPSESVRPVGVSRLSLLNQSAVVRVSPSALLFGLLFDAGRTFAFQAGHIPSWRGS
jgi:hypothetical protein